MKVQRRFPAVIAVAIVVGIGNFIANVVALGNGFGKQSDSLHMLFGFPLLHLVKAGGFFSGALGARSLEIALFGNALLWSAVAALVFSITAHRRK